MKSKEKVLVWCEIYALLNRPIKFVKPIQLHIIRHAETTFNAQKLITGSLNPPLSEKGIAQAKALGLNLEESYDVAFCSQLDRAIKTLEIAQIEGQIQIPNLIYDSRLNERGLGSLEGQPRQFIPAFSTGDLSYAPPQGESYEEVIRRILSFLLDLHKQEGSTVLICGHAGVLRILVGIIQDLDTSKDVLALSFANAEVLKVTWSQLKIPNFLKNQ
jgi:broad specificity phosphatase PhoE